MESSATLKRIAVSGLVTALLISSVSWALAANPEAGAKCSKLGQTQIYKNKKFTCIKSSKKLIWSKGVLVKNQEIAPKPASSAAPTLSPTPSATPVIPKSAKEVATENFLLVASKSMKEIKEYASKNSNSRISNKYFDTLNFPVEILSGWKKQIETSSKFFGSFIDSSQEARIYFLTEKDREYMDSLGLWNSDNSPSDWFSRWESGQELDNCTGIAAWFLKARNQESPSLHGGIAIASNAKANKMSPWCQHIISHELFHGIQDYWLFSKKSAHGFDSIDKKDQLELPIFREGSTDAVTLALVSKNIDEYYSVMYSHWRRVKQGSNLLQGVASVEKVPNLMKVLESRSNHPEAHDLSYFIGQLFFEYLISEYGFGKYVELVQMHNEAVNMEELFPRVYGKSLMNLYVESSDHIFNGIEAMG